MDNIIEAISEFIGAILSTVIIGGSILLLAGELRLAALRKASHGSAKLSSFTERMTKVQYPLARRSLSGGSQKNKKRL
jgi:hypothetical protein